MFFLFMLCVWVGGGEGGSAGLVLKDCSLQPEPGTLLLFFLSYTPESIALSRAVESCGTGVECSLPSLPF